ncbi:Fic/DOC family protein [Nocardioides zeae]|uniref:Fic/DOC family protein n=1 Tax=Nocardioides zeae TaxID=1457234 RepID=UPI0019D5A943|nr:Fic family protein [Nocardioides zeae]
MGITTNAGLRSAENDLVEVRIAELRSSPIIIRQTFDGRHLKALHRWLFQDVYHWAGEFRTVGIAKAGESFVPPLNIEQPLQHVATRIAELDQLRSIENEDMPEVVAYLYDYLNYAHPFREGNGRTQREFFDQLLARSGRGLDWERIDMEDLHNACHSARAFDDLGPLVEIVSNILIERPG